MERIKQLVKQYEDLTSINFVWLDKNNTADVPDIRIAFQENKGNTSYVGNENHLPGAKQDACTMNLESIKVLTRAEEFDRIILHEFGHALGCVHEHQSPAARQDDWNTQAVYNYYAGKPNNWDTKKVDDNIFKRYTDAEITNNGYDPTSIMHYQFPASFFKNGKESPYNTKLSDLDRKLFQKLYPKQYSRSDGLMRFLDPKPGTIGKPVQSDLPEPKAGKTLEVNFDVPYRLTPKIALGLSDFALEPEKPSQLQAEVTGLDESGFKLSLKSPADSALISAGVTWFEIEEGDPSTQSIQPRAPLSHIFLLILYSWFSHIQTLGTRVYPQSRYFSTQVLQSAEPDTVDLGF